MNLFSSKIICLSHSKNNLDINKKTFQVSCLECEKEGIAGVENLRIEENLNDEESKQYNSKKRDEKIIQNILQINEIQPRLSIKHYNCFKHTMEDALFYCDDCFEFICKTCFAVEHRNHKSSTPELIEKNIKEDVDKLINNLETLKKSVETNIKNVSELDHYFLSQKLEVQNTLKIMNEEINKNMNIKSKELTNEIENIFNGIDSEVENSSQRLNITKRKGTKMLDDFKTINKEIEDIKSDKKICLYKKNKDAFLSENKKFLIDLQLFMNENLEKTKSKSVTGMETFLKKCSAFQKNSEIYENSIVNTINSGIPNICMRIRRFRRYFFMNSRYLKTTSLCFSTSQSINIVGLSLCGLFNNKSQNIKMDFEIKIYELDSEQKFENKKTPVYESYLKIPTICNVVDPVVQFYLTRTLAINKDKIYYIIISNLDPNAYIDIWTGEILTEKSEKKIENQSVLCNNTGVKFNFIRANGVQSDFDEFNEGLISDIIFSHID